MLELAFKRTTPSRGSHADQHCHEIWQILYLHRNYYNGIWNY